MRQLIEAFLRAAIRSALMTMVLVAVFMLVIWALASGWWWLALAILGGFGALFARLVRWEGEP